jgi:hypothetical protein
VQPHEYRARILDCSVEGKAGERIEYGAGQWEVGSHCQQSRQGSPARGLEERDAVENEAVYCIAYNTVYIKFRSIAQTSIIRAGDQASARTFPSVGICSTMAPLAVDTCTRSDESYGQCAGVRKYAYDATYSPSQLALVNLICSLLHNLHQYLQGEGITSQH